MTATRSSGAGADAAHVKPGDVTLSEAGGDRDPEQLSDDEVEVIPLRVEPLLQQNASPVDIDKGTRLIQSCRDGDLSVVQRQVVDGSPAGFVTKTGWTPIAAAAYSGKSEIVRYLLDLGADAMYIKSTKRYGGSYGQQQGMTGNAPSANGDSTTSLSKATPSSEALEPHLASNSSNSNIANGATTTISSSASSAGPVAAKPVLGSGVNTPLHWACYKGHAEIVTLLLHAGYSIEDADPIGNRCLHLACSGGFREVIEILLANSAAVDQRNRYGNRPLDLATDPSCRKLLLKFQSHTTCEWCKEAFNRIRRPSLCQHCRNVYCDVKPCSSITEIVTPVDLLRPGTASTSAIVRSMRYCQDCATEMGKTEQELRTILDAKLELVRSVLVSITPSASSSADASARSTDSRPATAANGAVPAPLAGEVDPAAGAASVPDAAEAAELTASAGSFDMDGVEPPSADDGAGATSAIPKRRLFTNDEIARALVLSQTDAEALYTSIEAAQLKAVDRELIQRARQTYHQLVAHVALQEEIKALMLVRPIGVRSLIEPLKTALLHARRAGVSEDMLMLGVQVIRGAEAECTLYGCEAMCAKIELGTKMYTRDIARLEASLLESQSLGVNDKLLAAATALRDRLNAEVQLQACLQPFTPLQSTDASGLETTLGYRFEDGAEVQSLLQALELRNQKVQAAVDIGSAVDGVSPALLEDASNVLKQLKKEIKDELKNEEERRRLEEEAALKAAKKGKKKK